jgi:hypothetical protein
MEPLTRLKTTMVNRIVNSFVDIVFIIYTWISRVVHFEDMYNYHVEYLCPSTSQEMEGSQFGCP